MLQELGAHAGLATTARKAQKHLYHALLDHLLMKLEWQPVMAAQKDIIAHKVV